MTRDTDLLPCPFCGAEPPNLHLSHITGRIFCAGCGAEGPWPPAFDGDWNTRAHPVQEPPSSAPNTADLLNLIRWAHDTLYEINPSNYDHDEVCRLNDASVEVILGLAPVLGETHGKSPEWWTDHRVGPLPSPGVTAGATGGRCKVPEGQTPLDDKLGHRLLDVIKEGQAARDSGTGSPYHGHSLEHCLHATGWVQRDLRLALDAADLAPPAPVVPAEGLERALLAHHEWHQRLGVIVFPPEDDQDGPTEIDMSAEYADSRLHEQTVAALSGASIVQSVDDHAHAALSHALQYLRGEAPNVMSGGHRNGQLRSMIKWVLLGCGGPLRSAPPVGARVKPLAAVFDAAQAEAEKAMRKFPQPNYVISKVAEEAGEVVKAAIHCAENRETKEAVLGEVVQCMAMLIRLCLEGDQVHGLAALLPAEGGE